MTTHKNVIHLPSGLYDVSFGTPFFGLSTNMNLGMPELPPTQFDMLIRCGQDFRSLIDMGQRYIVFKLLLIRFIYLYNLSK